jgi:uncharacterized protein YegP (UPF0339 family)
MSSPALLRWHAMSRAFATQPTTRGGATTMHFSIWRSTDNQLYFELKGDNNETVAVSETYGRKESAIDTIEAIKRGAATADVRDHSAGTKYERELPR